MKDKVTHQLTVSSSAQQVDRNGSQQNKSIPIERRASWTYSETKILLSLWGQNMVQRQLANSKRTRHVWEKISERIKENGYDRNADQVRTRIFNMVAEYKRILRNPTYERRKKCIFFNDLHNIFRAKNSNPFGNVPNNYDNEQYNFDPIVFPNKEDVNELNGDDNSDDCDEPYDSFAYTLSPSELTQSENCFDLTNNEGSLSDQYEDVSPLPKRRRIDEIKYAIENDHELDSPLSAILIDRVFTHLQRETEIMHKWVNLEKEKLALEMERRKEEKEREERREKAFLQILSQLQSQVFSMISNQPNSDSNPSSTTIETKSVNKTS
ncbi:hypothetical protein BLOT_000431 [Blomia tropicalis]|nr:hypothetical protein BLOT_000431 [Blomia tropicalis]